MFPVLGDGVEESSATISDLRWAFGGSIYVHAIYRLHNYEFYNALIHYNLDKN